MLGVMFCGACSGLPAASPLLRSTDEAASFQTFGRAEYCGGTVADSRDALFRRSFCAAADEPEVVELTPARMAELQDVQKAANADIRYRSTTSWSPLSASGDCKTYSARKQLELLARGWPQGALRIATAYVPQTGGGDYHYHAVLLVDTDRGTLVLDNRYERPRRWEELEYVWMTAQTPGRTEWARLPAAPERVALAMRRAASTVQVASR